MAKGFRYKHLQREEVRSWLETPEGQRALGLVHCWVRSAFASTGAMRAGALFPAFLPHSHRPHPFAYEPDQVMACVERLDELGEVVELTSHHQHADEHRVFVPALRAYARGWDSVRASIGVVSGAPADAVEDTAAVY